MLPNSVLVNIGGVKLEAFYISTLAEALNRDPHTIRTWERTGILPDCMLRDKNNRRLYSKEQIDVIVECAEAENLRQGSNIAKTNFISLVHERLDIVKQKYIN